MNLHLHMWRPLHIDWNKGLPVQRWDCRCGEETWSLLAADLPDFTWYAFLAALIVIFITFVVFTFPIVF